MTRSPGWPLRLLAPAVAVMVTDAGPEVELLRWFALMPGKLHLWGGDLEGAVRWFETAARFAEPMTDNWVVAQALPGLAEALRRLGRPDEARAQADRAITLAGALDMPHVRADALDELAFLAAGEQDPARAEDLHHGHSPSASSTVCAPSTSTASTPSPASPRHRRAPWRPLACSPPATRPAS